MIGTTEQASSPEDYIIWKGAKLLWPVDMPDYLVDYTVTRSKKLIEELNPDKSSSLIAETLKKELDQKWGLYWHVTVGKNFGSYVVHQKRRFVYFTLGHVSFLIYKAQ
ncbi:dynein light chain type 1 [Cystoisospora suis]|uniref:Dynein light chain n=1 Tax=Cystoisospora suis TaxID=483139 RepID=A0A2C6LEC6_9APIC|nr:dynein light chain type 1 [Cystoisospora suis]